MTAAVLVEGVDQVYERDGEEVHALRSVSLQVRAGEQVALVGPSGSGKSTLLSLLAALLAPTSGRVVVGGHDLATLAERERLALRARKVGVVVQDPGRNLLPYADVTENLLFAQRAGGLTRSARRARAAELLDAVGLGDSARKTVRALSGGEQQRLALAAGLANRPALLLADEPTSQLDASTASRVVAVLRDVAAEAGTTLVVVTHDAQVGAALGRTVTLRDGRVVRDEAHG